MSARILFLDHVGVLGGGELCLLDIARHFRARSQVILFEDGPFRAKLEEEGVAVEVWPMGEHLAGVRRKGRGLRDLLAVPSVLALAARLVRLARRYDMLYANTQKSMVVAGIAGALARRPVVWHLHDLLIDDHFSVGHRRLATALANRFASHIIANSEATAEAFVKAGGRAERVRVVYNSIDPAPFEMIAPEEVEQLRADLGLNGAPLVGVFSRLAPWKGQHVLLDALADLPGTHALLVGDTLFGPDRGYDAELREQVSRLGLTERVHFLGFRHDIPALMKLVDIVVHTSTAPEPFGRVIVEAMMARKPVVATDAGGARELVEQERTGILVPPGDVGALHCALVRLRDDDGAAMALAEAGAKEARRRFSPPQVLREIEDVCQMKLQR